MAYDKKSSDMASISGLWMQESKAGNKYMSGTINQEAINAIVTAGVGAKIMIFKVKDKKHEKSPDYSMMIAPPNEAAKAKPEIMGHGEAIAAAKAGTNRGFDRF